MAPVRFYNHMLMIPNFTWLSKRFCGDSFLVPETMEVWIGTNRFQLNPNKTGWF